MRTLDKTKKLEEMLLEKFQGKVNYNRTDKTVYYRADVDLEALTKATKGYKVFIQLILF